VREEVIELTGKKLILPLRRHALKASQLIVNMKDTRGGVGKLPRKYGLERGEWVTPNGDGHFNQAFARNDKTASSCPAQSRLETKGKATIRAPARPLILERIFQFALEE
jgi:hypothetical protein